jgi:hypothetical protein
MFTSRTTAPSCKEAPGDAPVVFGFAARAPGDPEWAKQAAAMQALKAERGQKHHHESRIAEPDWQTIIRAVKQVH